MVAVIGDGFRAAQDLRLVRPSHGERPSLTDEPQKIDHIADDVYAEWLAHRDEDYPGADGQPIRSPAASNWCSATRACRTTTGTCTTSCATC